MNEGCENHEWLVFSIALTEGWLMVQCVQCGRHGTVDEPTAEEWSAARHAPTKPYRWAENARVTIRKEGPRYVARKGDGYERIPRELMGKVLPVSTKGQKELEELARLADRGDLCGELFPLFVQSCQRDTGWKATEAVKRLARRFKESAAKGMRVSPCQVASALRWYAREGSSA